MSSLQQHAQKVVMERTPYKNRLFVIYAVKAAFEKDPTVPGSVVEAVQYAVEDYTQIKTRALQTSDVSATSKPSLAEAADPPPPPSGGGAPAPLAAAPQDATNDENWKQRLAEAIDLVMAHSGEKDAALDSDALGGGGEDNSVSSHPPDSLPGSSSLPAPSSVQAAGRRKRFTESEIRNLRAGVQIHGQGNWTQILNDSRLQFDDIRTPVSLKDKWRHLSKKKV